MSVFPGTSELASRCRAFDWAATALGPVDRWPQSLRTTAATVLAAGFPTIVLWGPELVQLYNDDYVPILGVKHPWGLGIQTRVCWSEVWDFNAPIYERVFAGETVTLHDQRYPLLRRGPDAPPDDVYLTISYAPVRDDTGGVGGVLIMLFDTSAQVAARRLEAERDRLLAESEAANAQLQDQGLELELSNQQLQEQAAELEAATEALQATAADLEEQVAAADRAAAALRHSEERYAMAARATYNAIWDWDLATDALAWNEGLSTLFGHPPGAVPEGSTPDGIRFWYDHIHPDDRERVVAGIHRVIDDPAGGSTWADAYRFRRGDGTYADVVDRGYVARQGAAGHGTAGAAGQGAAGDAGGRAARMIGAMEDVTARRAAEAALTASDARYRALVGSIDAGFCVIELLFDERGDAVDYRYLEASAAFERQSGLVDVVGRRIREFAPDLEAHWFATFGRVARTGEPARSEEHAAALGRWFDVFAYRVDDPALRRVALLVTDVTAAKAAARERERLLAEAEAARAEAEAANRAKAEFLAVMSHELRTPLNAIAGYAELIELGIYGPVTPAQIAALERVQRSQRHLLGLINGVLNYAKVGAGHVHYEIADVPLDELLATCEALTAPQARARRLRVEFGGCPPELRVRADAEKVQQVVLNLLTNALKFTEPGGAVTVGSDATHGTVAVRVHDTGLGIVPEQLERVFQPFVQVDARLTRTQEGVGLGLAISRDLARGMGGDLTAASTPGVGSTFTLTLPAA